MMTNLVTADHVSDWVILKDGHGDILAKLEPEKAVKLSQSILDAAGKAMNGHAEEVDDTNI